MPSRELYSVTSDPINQSQWDSILAKFDDANLSQSWSYGSVRWGAHNLSHIRLFRDGEIVGAAQVVTKAVPFLGTGICRVRGGPVWQARGRRKDPEILRQMLRALEETHVKQRGLFLQVFPAILEDTPALRQIFEEEGFQSSPDGADPKTALIDLSYSLPDIRKSLKQKWRQHLVRAERNNLTVKRGTSSELLAVVGDLYLEGLRRRHLAPVVSVDQLLQTQNGLPEPEKIRVMVCECNGKLVSGIAVPVFGNTGQALISGTADWGLKLYGSYLLHWRMVEWLKEHRCRWYDLDGINPTVHSGDTQFKLGVAGKLGLQMDRIGRFQSSGQDPRVALIRAGLLLREAYTEMRVAFASGIPSRLSKMAARNRPRHATAA